MEEDLCVLPHLLVHGCRPTREQPLRIQLILTHVHESAMLPQAGMSRSPCSPPSPCHISCVTPMSSVHQYIDGEPQNCRTKGRAASPPSTSMSPCSIASREIRSNALIPYRQQGGGGVKICHRLSDVGDTLASGCVVDSANWKGDVCCSTAGPSCWASVPATTRRIKSPTIMPRIPLWGFCNAVIRPILTSWRISGM